MGDFAHQEELDGRRVEPIRKTICKPFYSQAWFQTIGIIEERGSGTGGPVGGDGLCQTDDWEGSSSVPSGAVGGGGGFCQKDD